jgi:hypothetical protein
MKLVFSVVMAVLVLAGATYASDRQKILGTTLDACDLQGRGLTIATTHACVRITGGVSFTEAWGNYKTDDYGYPINGQKLVTTPGGVFTIPAPDM